MAPPDLPSADPITDADLQGFVDGQLSPERRLAVERHLAQHPAEAARVMADLQGRDELRLAFGAAQVASGSGASGSGGSGSAGSGSGGAGPGGRGPRAADAARRLERALDRRDLLLRLRRIAAVAALVTLGWFAHAELGPLSMTDSIASPRPPGFVETAMMSHRTALVRATMHSQPQAHDYDAAEMRAATGIVMPDLPDEWRVLDVQLFPSRFGPSVEVVVASPELGTVSLFAARPGTFAVIVPTVAPAGEQQAAYWQVGEAAYALVGAAEGRALERAATSLARALH
jgi:anti-sigma factor RsiW